MAGLCGAKLELVDWGSRPVNDFRCYVTRARNWFECQAGLPARREVWLIKAETLPDAERVARHHFYRSADIEVASATIH